jgi:hypothetical protein
MVVSASSRAAALVALASHNECGDGNLTQSNFIPLLCRTAVAERLAVQNSNLDQK